MIMYQGKKYIPLSKKMCRTLKLCRNEELLYKMNEQINVLLSGAFKPLRSIEAHLI
jgi:hypothetical protein